DGDGARRPARAAPARRVPADGAPAARAGEGGAIRRGVREHRQPRAARRLGGGPGGAADVKRLAIVLAVLAVAALGAFAVLRNEQPNWGVALLDAREHPER